MSAPGLSSYLLRWEHARSQGQELTPEQLCGDRPDLIEPLARLIEAARGVESAETMPPPEGQGGPVEVPPSLSPPGYEILGELGRGGMGVVYKARQLALNRVVALKMILQGGHAAAEERQRFFAEAEAIARVRHPNIVQVFDFGTHEGVAYFSLEYSDGGSLADQLNGTPQPGKPAARLVEQLAHAAQAAHEAGIVHRDLKPANVLLQRGTTKDTKHTKEEAASIPSSLSSVSCVSWFDVLPKITDFGLAKRTEGHSTTQTGAVMGTPSYMAPEQAIGSKQIGPAADIYALGSILYECLTGRPPFKAATSYDTILQVIQADPVPPRRLNPGVPTDLETICLKCLEKTPAKRYASAADLADDLARWQRGEPIVARPVGRLERAAKWVRRNLAVSALVAAVAVVTLAGLVATTGLYLRATQLAADRGQALVEVETERNLARLAEEKTRAALDEVEATLVEGLLRPIGRTNNLGDAAEIEAIHKLGTLSSDRLRVRFLEAGLLDPHLAARLQLRADMVMNTLVGVHPHRRDQLGEFLRQRVGDPNLPEDSRRTCVLLRAGLRQIDEPLAREATAWFRDEIDRGQLDTAAARTLLVPILEALPPAAARPLAGQAAEAVLAALGKNSAGPAMLELARALADLCGVQEESQAVRAARWGCEAVLAAMAKTTDGTTLAQLAHGLAALTPRLPAAQAREVCDRGTKLLVVMMPKQRETHHVLRTLGEAVEVLGGRVEDGPLREATEFLLTLVRRPRDGYAQHSGTVALAHLTPLLPPAQKDEATRQALRAILASVVVRSREVDDDSYPVASLGVLADRLPEGQAREAIAVLLPALDKAPPGLVFRALVDGIHGLLARIRPAERRATVEAVARVLLPLLAMNNDPNAVYNLKDALVTLAPLLTDAQAEAFADALVAALPDASEAGLVAKLDALAALWPKLPAARAERLAGRAADAALAALAAKPVPTRLDTVCRGIATTLPALPGRKGAVADQVAAALLDVLRKSPHPETLRLLCPHLQLYGPHLSAGQADEAARFLVGVLARTVDRDLSEAALDGLTAVAPRLTPAAAGPVARELFGELQKPRENVVVGRIALTLAVLLARLPNDEANDLTDRAAGVCLATLARTPYNGVWSLCQALRLMTPRVREGRAREAASATLVVFARSAYWNSIDEEVGLLLALADRLPAAEGRVLLVRAGEVYLAKHPRLAYEAYLPGTAKPLQQLAGRLPDDLGRECGNALAHAVLRHLNTASSSEQDALAGELIYLPTPALVRCLRVPVRTTARAAVLTALSQRLRREFRSADEVFAFAARVQLAVD